MLKNIRKLSNYEVKMFPQFLPQWIVHQVLQVDLQSQERYQSDDSYASGTRINLDEDCNIQTDLSAAHADLFV